MQNMFTGQQSKEKKNKLKNKKYLINNDSTLSQSYLQKKK